MLKTKILVVDDDHEIGFMMKLMLEHRGFTVIISQRADRLEQIILEQNIKLVILDMLIAGVRGTDVCLSIKQNAATSHLPVMMITALPDAEATCREAGADEFLAKPFEMKMLISKINKFVNVLKQTT